MGVPMSTPRETVERFLRALEALDEPAIHALLHDDAVYQNVPLPPDRGKAAVIRTLRRFTRLVDHVELRLVHIAESGSIVLTERVDVLAGPLVHAEFWVCGTFEVRDEKVVLWRDHFDPTELLAGVLLGKAKRLLFR